MYGCHYLTDFPFNSHSIRNETEKDKDTETDRQDAERDKTGGGTDRQTERHACTDSLKTQACAQTHTHTQALIYHSVCTF